MKDEGKEDEKQHICRFVEYKNKDKCGIAIDLKKKNSLDEICIERKN